MSTAFLSASSEFDNEIVKRIAFEIAEVESVLQQELQSDVGLVETVGLHTLSAGGKRLRPALVSLCASAMGSLGGLERARKLGACMELIHMATLVHDDVIDHSDTRRGRPTAASVFGNTAAILSGDAMLAKAMRILAYDGDLQIIRLVSGVVVDLAEGEILELSLRSLTDVSMEDHYEVLRRKTATFIQTCCAAGAMAASADDQSLKAFETFGMNLGMAFQIVDDLLDYSGVSAKTGKQSATDFQEGCATLPLIHFLANTSEERKSEVCEWFGGPLSEACRVLLDQWMTESGSLEFAESEAKRFSSASIEALSHLPPSDEVQLLKGVANLVVHRDR